MSKKLFAVLAMVATAIILPASLLAWGPSRQTYTMQEPADHVTFNSITDNPNYGDERNFVTIKDASNTTAGGWMDQIAIQSGREYYVRMYVHNNAAANLNLVAQNTVARFNVPTYTSNRIQIDGYLSADNATPTTVWDQAVFTNSSDFNLSYVAGSATYTNNVFTSGTALSDAVIGSGTRLGYTSLDGRIPGCMQYTGYVIFKVRASAPGFTMQKTVRINGLTDRTWRESVTANPGDTVDFQIYFENTGSTQLQNVIVKDTLPAGLSYIAGSTYLANSGGTRNVADGIVSNGLTIGGYLPTGNAYIKYSARVANNNGLANCGLNSMVNTARITTTAGTQEDTSTVNVTKTCAVTPPATPELPKTGAGDDALAFLGFSAIATSSAYYVASRRAAAKK